ncbi:MAG: sigma-E processing peptidase SpoIIGA [Clostridia bacterium]|nr:sigma-E processing peptidase SpoIIGA [Clostridia bacterium]
MTVYVDVLLVINIYVNFFLLLCTERLSNVRAGRLGILSGAFVGGLYSLSVFLDISSKLLSLALNLAALSLMVLVSFKPKSVKVFLKLGALFLLVNIAFAGIMLAVWLFAAPQKMMYEASVLYFDIDVKLLVLLTAASYLVIRLGYTLLRRRAPDKKTVNAVLSLNNRSLSATALIDTGHSLRDGFSGSPVAVADKKAFKSLTGYDADELLKLSREGGETPLKIRLIPVNTVSSSGVLTAVRADYIITDAGERCDKILVAQSNTPFATDEYSLIINSDIF